MDWFWIAPLTLTIGLSIIAFGFIIPTEPNQAEEDDPEQAPYNLAAMRKLMYLNRVVLNDADARDQRKQIDRARQEAALLTDPRWKRAYDRWISHYEYKLERSIRINAEMAARRPAFEASQKRWAENSLAADRLLEEKPPR